MKRLTFLSSRTFVVLDVTNSSIDGMTKLAMVKVQCKLLAISTVHREFCSACTSTKSTTNPVEFDIY
jgi:hypothetical protein